MMKTDPKCWLCGTFVLPSEPAPYQPLICEECLLEYKKRKFIWIRPKDYWGQK